MTLWSKVRASIAGAMMFAVVTASTPAEAQSISNFAADVNTSINRGLDYLTASGAFSPAGYWAWDYTGTYCDLDYTLNPPACAYWKVVGLQAGDAAGFLALVLQIGRAHV